MQLMEEKLGKSTIHPVILPLTTSNNPLAVYTKEKTDEAQLVDITAAWPKQYLHCPHSQTKSMETRKVKKEP